MHSLSFDSVKQMIIWISNAIYKHTNRVQFRTKWLLISGFEDLRLIKWRDKYVWVCEYWIRMILAALWLNVRKEARTENALNLSTHMGALAHCELNIYEVYQGVLAEIILEIFTLVLQFQHACSILFLSHTGKKRQFRETKQGTELYILHVNAFVCSHTSKEYVGFITGSVISLR